MTRVLPCLPPPPHFTARYLEAVWLPESDAITDGCLTQLITRCKRLHTLEVGGAGVTNTFLEAVCDRGEHDVYADWKVRCVCLRG